MSQRIQELSHFWGKKQLNPSFYPQMPPQGYTCLTSSSSSKQELSARDGWDGPTGSAFYLENLIMEEQKKNEIAVGRRN